MPEEENQSSQASSNGKNVLDVYFKSPLWKCHPVIHIISLGPTHVTLNILSQPGGKCKL